MLNDIETTCDWIVMIEGGRIVRNSALDTFTAGETVQVEVLRDADLVADVLRTRGADVKSAGLRLEVTTIDEDPYDLITRVLAETGAGLQMLRPSVTTLEDAYLSEEHGAG